MRESLKIDLEHRIKTLEQESIDLKMEKDKLKDKLVKISEPDFASIKMKSTLK
jgi:hypothetical protein